MAISHGGISHCLSSLYSVDSSRRNVRLCRLTNTYWHFGGACRLHLQAPTVQLFDPYGEAKRFSETSVNLQVDTAYLARRLGISIFSDKWILAGVLTADRIIGDEIKNGAKLRDFVMPTWTKMKPLTKILTHFTLITLWLAQYISQ